MYKRTEQIAQQEDLHNSTDVIDYLPHVCQRNERRDPKYLIHIGIADIQCIVMISISIIVQRLPPCIRCGVRSGEFEGI